jgi:hypothetical protein
MNPIRRARADEAELLSELAYRSMTHWDSTPEFADAYRLALTLTTESITTNLVYLVEDEGRIAGFYALQGLEDGNCSLTHLYVEPTGVSKGAPLRLWNHAVRTARQQGYTVLLIKGDQYSERFYTALGAQRVGETPSKVHEGQMLPIFEFDLSLQRAMSAPTPAKPTPITANVESVARAIQNLISLVLGLAAALTAGGFIVVNSHLAKFTDIHGYSVNPRQYLAAGVGLLIPPFLAVGIVAGAYYLGRLLGTFLRNRDQSQPVETAPRPTRRIVPQRLTPTLRILEGLAEKRNFRRLLIAFGLGLYTILFGLFYGEYIYGSIPHYLGGGRPEPMLLVFNDAENLSLLHLSAAWHIPSNRVTRTVLLLAELNDGVLVADTNTGHVAYVKNSLLTGVVDEAIVEWIITPTPTPPTPTATPSTNLTPTP